MKANNVLSFLDTLSDAVVNGRPTTAIILAAGSSERFSGRVGVKKQFCPVLGVPAVLRSALAFEECSDVKQIIVVTGQDDIEKMKSVLDGKITKLSAVTAGGATRLDSAKAGLSLVDPSSKYIAVHDAARCLVTVDIIKSVIAEAVRSGAAAAATPASDTIKLTSGGRTVAETLDRDRIWLAATPQIFSANLYRAAIYTAIRDGVSVTDDCSAVERLGVDVKLVDCGRENIKITYPVDAAIAEAILERRAMEREGGTGK
ncbi:MAG: 2-C-methyl-D-erythritol 4-phosphate cytidylyltransferase [Clostridia bacterium]|nr:2-C-methyl-D-erythritol 4-phosphate cytidylyltransferase [Clostridia bacterium]